MCSWPRARTKHSTVKTYHQPTCDGVHILNRYCTCTTPAFTTGQLAGLQPQANSAREPQQKMAKQNPRSGMDVTESDKIRYLSVLA